MNHKRVINCYFYEQPTALCSPGNALIFCWHSPLLLESYRKEFENRCAVERRLYRLFWTFCTSFQLKNDLIFKIIKNYGKKKSTHHSERITTLESIIKRKRPETYSWPLHLIAVWRWNPSDRTRTRLTIRAGRVRTSTLQCPTQESCPSILLPFHQLCDHGSYAFGGLWIKKKKSKTIIIGSYTPWKTCNLFLLKKKKIKYGWLPWNIWATTFEVSQV